MEHENEVFSPNALHTSRDGLQLIEESAVRATVSVICGHSEKDADQSLPVYYYPHPQAVDRAMTVRCEVT